MSMRKSTRQELRKCRELLRFTLRGKKCWFCRKPLMDDVSYAKDGDGQGSPIARTITVHHKDGDHQNDDQENKVLVHTTCHKRHHMLERHAARRTEKAANQKEAA
jgi:hypothetical protein